MQLLFVRHGESEANVLREISNRNLVHPLTPRGRSEAEQLALSLAALEVAAIYSSPLLRALQTADLLAAALGAELTVTDALRECDCGDIEGRSDEDAWRQHTALMVDWADPMLWHRRIPGGESLHDVHDRLVPFINTLIEEHRASAATLVLVGHGGIFRALLPTLLTNVDAAFANAHPITNTGTIVAEHLDGALVCREWCGEGVG
jgi:broad specificity phosphatase PhoE